jgi:hypothetical protein
MKPRLARALITSTTVIARSLMASLMSAASRGK